MQGNEALSLAVLDNGNGFAVDRVDAGLGLGTMNDYAEVAGGQLDLNSSAGSGTDVKVVLPI